MVAIGDLMRDLLKLQKESKFNDSVFEKLINSKEETLCKDIESNLKGILEDLDKPNIYPIELRKKDIELLKKAQAICKKHKDIRSKPIFDK